MAKRCATLAEFVDLVPEFLTLGDASTGTLVVASQPAPGDSITLTDPYAFPPVVETLIAGTDYAIGVDEAATAANIAAAMDGGSLVTASAIGATVYVASVKTGAAGAVGISTTNPAALQWSGVALTGGDALVLFSLECACSMINLECWGTKASCGSIYLAAHVLTVAGGGEGGAVNRKKIDKIEVSFAATGTATGIDANFGSTKWGRLYLAMKKTIFVAPIAGRRFLPGVC
jgi:hypothetical protein